MAQTVTLENTKGRLLQVDVQGPGEGLARRTISHRKRTLNKKSGKMGIRRREFNVNDPLYIPAGRAKRGLPVWVADHPNVKRLERRKEIKVTVVTE